MDMVTMLMGNKYRLNSGDGDVQTFQAFLNLAAGGAYVNQYTLFIVADVVAITVTSGVQRGDKEGHAIKDKAR